MLKKTEKMESIVGKEEPPTTSVTILTFLPTLRTTPELLRTQERLPVRTRRGGTEGARKLEKRKGGDSVYPMSNPDIEKHFPIITQSRHEMRKNFKDCLQIILLIRIIILIIH
jgi:hypothetical protein